MTKHRTDLETMHQQTSPDHAKSEETQLPSTAEAHIAAGLKQLYGQMLAEPMPDKFAGLLDQLAQADKKTEQK